MGAALGDKTHIAAIAGVLIYAVPEPDLWVEDTHAVRADEV